MAAKKRSTKKKITRASKKRSTRRKPNSVDSNSGDTGEFSTGSKVGTALIADANGHMRPVQYVVIDDMAIVEGDINLGSVEKVEQETEIARRAMRGEISLGVVVTGSNRRWPNCEIPFMIDSALTNQARVTDAIEHWENNTNYRFIERTTANAAQFPDFVTFRSAGNCSANVGRQGGEQFVNLSTACSTGNTIHEIGHVIGLWHEQSRSDRDAFVTINFDNIDPAAISNFNQRISDGDDVGPYDYGSIMHYPRTAFSINGLDTIVPTDPTASIGQRTGLSSGDIVAANSICTPASTGSTNKFADDLGNTGTPLKFIDDTISRNKFMDDIGTSNKFLDDTGTPVKFIDDGGTPNKFTDDGGTPLKFIDDGGTPNKFTDDGGTPNKFTDDGGTPLKFIDDGGTPNKFTDDGGTPNKFVDDGGTPNKFLDDGDTPNKFIDDGGTPNKFLDDGDTGNKFIDDPTTANKFADDGGGTGGTGIKQLDDVKSPTQDKGPLDVGPERPGQINPNIGTGSVRLPFALATPHHASPAMVAAAGGVGSMDAGQLGSSIEQLYQYVEALAKAPADHRLPAA